MLYGLDLFSGIGGITKGLEQWVKPIAYCEQDKYCQAVLANRIIDGSLPNAPIWDDVKTLEGKMLPVKPDIIYGGFPCQDISVCGNQKGIDGERSGLFFEIVRLIEEVRPEFVFLENVPNIRTKGLDRVIQEFTRLRYDFRWTIVSAAEVGAPHVRKRWFLLADANIKGLEGGENTGRIKSGGEKFVEFPTGQGEPFKRENWQIEPDVGRMVDGLPFRVDRIKALGNAVVPEQVSQAFKKLLCME